MALNEKVKVAISEQASVEGIVVWASKTGFQVKVQAVGYTEPLVAYRGKVAGKDVYKIAGV